MKKFFNIATLVFLFIVLVIPNRQSAITPLSFVNLPLELILVGLIFLIKGVPAIFIRGGATLLLVVGLILKITDLCTYQIFGRPFNPVLEANLIADGINLLNGTIGHIGALIVLVLIAALIAGIVLFSYVVLGIFQHTLQHATKKYGLGLIGALGIWLIMDFYHTPFASNSFYQLIEMHVSETIESINELKDFKNNLEQDADANVSRDTLFSKLKGKDVLVIFVESYGRTAIENPTFSPYVRAILDKSSANLTEKGFFSRSAYLTSPTYGGISWLAHGTLLSGLWVNSQLRYDQLVMSKHASLNRLFKQAGWRTVTLQPAHTMAWPQGEYFGYDKIYAANDLGYQGKPFNWITMPDQYTLSAFQKREHQPASRKPVMAEIVLISSHAPWVPIPHLVDWNQVGDGNIFNSQVEDSELPEVVWQDTGRIREQYRKSIEYAISTVVSYILHYGDDNLVVLVLGDHQPAPFVTQESQSHDVLVHLISRDESVIASIKDWHWSKGMLPADNAPVWKMDVMRGRLISAFSH